MSKELRSDIKLEMWSNTISFLKQIQSETIADICWQYTDDGAITGIEIKFEYPVYMTTEKETK